MQTVTITPEQFLDGDGRSIRRPVDRQSVTKQLRKVLNTSRACMETVHVLLYSLDKRIEKWETDPNSSMTREDVAKISEVLASLSVLGVKSPAEAVKTLQGEEK